MISSLFYPSQLVLVATVVSLVFGVSRGVSQSVLWNNHVYIWSFYITIILEAIFYDNGGIIFFTRQIWNEVTFTFVNHLRTENFADVFL